MALLAVYSALGCKDVSFCPLLEAGKPCPGLLPSQFSPRLVCRGGDVTQLALYFDMDADAARATAIQQQGGFGVLSPELAKLTSLNLFYLFRFLNVRGSLSVLSGLTRLRNLHLSDIDASDTLDFLAGMTDLYELDIRRTNVTGTIGRAITGLRGLQTLRLDQNRLQGTVAKLSSNPGTCILTSGTAASDPPETNCITRCDDMTCCPSLAALSCTVRPTAAPTPAPPTTIPPTPRPTPRTASSTAPSTAATTTPTTAPSLSTSTLSLSTTVLSITAPLPTSTASQTAVVELPPTTSNGAVPSPSSDSALIGGIAFGVCLALALVIAVVAAWLWKRRAARVQQSAVPMGSVPSSNTAVYGSSPLAGSSRSEYDSALSQLH